MISKSRHIERAGRGNLTAQTLAPLEAVESGDVIRAQLAEIHYKLDYHTHVDDVSDIKLMHGADCKSLYDSPQRRGAHWCATPSKRGLDIDIEELRADVAEPYLVSERVNTRQTLTYCLTENDAQAADYVRHVLETDVYKLTGCLGADQAVAEMRNRHKGECYQANDPKQVQPSAPAICQ